MNGHGFDDLMVGVDWANANGSGSGASYVVFASDFSGAVTYLGISGADSLSGTAASENLVAGLVHDTVAGGGNLCEEVGP